MDPVVITSLLVKLDNVLAALNKAGKKGLPDDIKSKNAINPAPDGSTIDPSSQPPKDAWLKKVGSFFGVSQGGLNKKSNIINETKTFAGAFLPELSKVLDLSLAKVTKILDKVVTNTASSNEGGGIFGGIFGGVSLGGVAKSLLIFVPALVAFTFITKMWAGIETGTVLKLLGGLALFFTGIIAFNKFKSQIETSLGTIIKFLLTMAGTAGVIMLFKDALMGWESIPYESLVKVGSIIGGLSLIVVGLSKIPLKNIMTGLATLTGIGLLMMGLGYVLPPLAQALQMMSSVNVEDIGKVGLIIGGIAALAGILGLIAKTGSGAVAFAAGALVLVGAGALAYALIDLIPPLATALKSMQGVEWSDIGKVATIITGIAALAGALGLIAMTGVGALAFAAGAAVILGAVGVAFALNELLPPLSQSLKSMQGVEWSDIGKVGVILGGLEIALAAAGGLSLLIAPGLLVFKGMIGVADQLQLLLPKIATAIKSVGGLSESDIEKSFNLLKSFMTGAGILFSGEGFFGKVGSFFSNLIGGVSASSLIAPYTLLASEISTLSGFIKTTVNNLVGIGDVNKVNSTLDILKAFLTGSGSLSDLSSPDRIKGTTTALQGLVSVIPSLGVLADSLIGIKTTLQDISSLKTFDSFGGSINIKSDQPLKVDMSATNDILNNIYMSSREMVGILKNMPVGGNTNIMMTPGQQSRGTQSGSLVGRSGPSYSTSPYNPDSILGAMMSP